MLDLDKREMLLPPHFTDEGPETQFTVCSDADFLLRFLAVLPIQTQRHVGGFPHTCTMVHK